MSVAMRSAQASLRPDVVAVDVETCHTTKGSVCQIGAAWRDDGGEVDVFESLVAPPPVPEWQFTEIHGITSDDCENAPPLADVWDEMQSLVNGRLPASHNAEFDRGHITVQLRNEGAEPPPRKGLWLCTLEAARMLWPGRPAKGGYRLTALAEYHGIDMNGSAHQAGADAAATLLLAEMLLDEWHPRRAPSLAGMAARHEKERRRGRRSG